MYITHYNSFGGANFSLYNLMLDMRARYNIIPSVLVPAEGDFPDKCRESNIEVLNAKYIAWEADKNSPRMKFTARIMHLLKYYPKRIRDCFRFSRILNNRQFDIVHTNASVIDIGELCSRILSVPHVWHLREYGFDDYDLCYVYPSFIVKSSYNKADAVIAISKSIYDSYVNARKLCSPDNTRIIYNGVRVPEEYEKIYQYQNGERLNLCMTGLIWHSKNQLMAVKACARLKTLTDRFTLHIIGAGDEDYISELNDLIRANNLDSNIKFWGFRYDAGELLKNMDVGLMLSKREAFGRVTVEYMLNYMPVIAADTGANLEIIDDNETGFICRLDDTEQLAELMHKFITNPELIKSMGLKAREHAVKNFSLERNTDEIYKLYHEILNLNQNP